MQLYEMQVSKTAICRTSPVQIPKGIIGAAVKLRFSPEWEGLSKTVVFRAGEVTKDVLEVVDVAVIPAECTQEEGALLQIGVYGTDADNTVAIPTLWAAIGRITEAADPSGDATTDPSLPVWAQLQAQIRQLEEQGVTQNEVEQAVKDFFGGYVPPGRITPQGGEIFNYYTEEVVTGDGKVYSGNTANKGAHAQNFGTHADGEYSSASGWNSTASGGISSASGRETVASGYCATSEGHLTKATAAQAHAGGKESEATGQNAFAYGLRAKATNQTAFATGEDTEASGRGSRATGQRTKASGNFAYAGGVESEATGAHTFAYGLRAKATNQTAFATGEDTEASGYCASAQGYKTKASGTCSSTTGRETEAQQYASSAQGRGTIATARNQSVRGSYNIPDTPNANGDGKYADIVGGGTSDTNRKNIYTLDWQGNAEFAGKVYSGGKALALSENTANKKRLKIPAGGSATITLAADTTYLVSASDNARHGCVLLQALDSTISPASNMLVELLKWTYSADGLNLTISETGGLYDLWISVVSL